MKKKVAVIGHFAHGLEYLDGQTIKTRILTKALDGHFGETQVLRFDTYGGKKTLLKAPLMVWRALKKSDNVLMLPAQNGIRVFGRLLPWLRPFFRGRKIHYAVIGGWLPKMLETKKGLARILKKFDGIYVETNTMKRALEAQDFKNVLVMPNCKELKVLAVEELVFADKEPYALCTFSRVSKEKGIEDAVEAVKTINERLGRIVYTLDIYGQVDSAQTAWFDSLQKEFPSYIRYGGTVPFDKSVEVLKNYFALLFPTYYEGEGFAGTLIDAYSAGVPVIASDWKYNAELVNGNVGCVYPTKDLKALVSVLEEVAANPMLLLNKKQSCLIEADKYKVDNAIRILLEWFA